MFRIGDLVLSLWIWVPLAVLALTWVCWRRQWRIPAAIGMAVAPFLMAATTIGLPLALTNAQLKLLPSWQYSSVLRLGVNSIGDAPPQWFTPSASACSIAGGDVGSQVATADGGCLHANYPAGDVDIRQWGASPAADIMPFLLKAWAANTGRCIHIPAGVWPVESSQTFTIGGASGLPPPCFTGDPASSHGDSAAPPALAYQTGTWLHWPAVSHAIAAPFTIVGTAPANNTYGDIFYASHAGIFNIAFSEDQPTPTTGWTPDTTYGYWFNLSNFYSWKVDGVLFYNDTHCINASGVGRFNIGTLQGQPLGTCLQIDQVPDLYHWHVVNFWPFWTDNPVVQQYTFGVLPVVFGQNSGFQWDQLFAIGYEAPLELTNLGNGVSVGGSISDYYADQSNYGLLVNAANTSIKIANMYGETFNFGTSSYPTSGGFIEIEGGGNNIIQIGQLETNTVGCAIVEDDNNTGSPSSVLIGSSNNRGGVNKSNSGCYAFAGAPQAMGPDRIVVSARPSFLSGVTAGLVNRIDQGNSTASSIAGTTLTLGGTITGAFEPGQIVYGPNVLPGTTITGPGVGGTWTVNFPQTAAAGPIGAYQNTVYDLHGYWQGWTPTISFVSGSIAYGSSGSYAIEDGKLDLEFQINTTGLSAPSGTAQISNLPLPCGAGMLGFGGALTAVNMTGLGTSTMVAIPSNAGINLYAGGDAGNTPVTGANFSATTVLGGSVSCKLFGS